jgi:hypothetical protein
MTARLNKADSKKRKREVNSSQGCRNKTTGVRKEELLYIYTYIYMYICLCVCVCVCVFKTLAVCKTGLPFH